MNDITFVVFIGLFFGVFIGLFFGVFIDALLGSFNVHELSVRHEVLIEKGLGLYCPTDGQFALNGECDK